MGLSVVAVVLLGFLFLVFVVLAPQTALDLIDRIEIRALLITATWGFLVLILVLIFHILYRPHPAKFCANLAYSILFLGTVCTGAPFGFAALENVRYAGGKLDIGKLEMAEPSIWAFGIMCVALFLFACYYLFVHAWEQRHGAFRL